jgi:hypothetical protein
LKTEVEREKMERVAGSWKWKAGRGKLEEGVGRGNWRELSEEESCKREPRKE